MKMENSNPVIEKPLLVYGRPGCPGLQPVLRLLDSAGVAYDYVNIREDVEAAARLRAITGGYESVPTIVLPDGRALVEPGTLKLKQILEEGASPGEQLVSTGEAVRAGLSNPVYIIMALIALAITVAVWLAMSG